MEHYTRSIKLEDSLRVYGAIVEGRPGKEPRESIQSLWARGSQGRQGLTIVQRNGYTWDRWQMTAHRLVARIDTQSVIMSIAFLTFNVVDAYLTQLNLAMGATELNPLAESVGGNMLFRALWALPVVALILYARKVRWLLRLNVLVLWVVVWNLWQYVGAECGWLPFR